MSIKLKQTVKSPLLWRQSPCTISFVTPKIVIDRIARFSVGSIYHKDKLHQQTRQTTYIQTPDLLLQHFRQKIREQNNINRLRQKNGSQHKYKSFSQKKQISFSRDNNSNQHQNTSQFEQKIDKNQRSSSAKNRSKTSQNIRNSDSKFQTNGASFSLSNRNNKAYIPNDYPGPGAYFETMGQVSKQQSISHKRRMKLKLKYTVKLKNRKQK